MPKFSSGRAAIMWAWEQFSCIGGSSFGGEGGGTVNGNISASLAQAIDIKRWLERAAFQVGLETIRPVLARALPQDEPVQMLPWMERRADDAMLALEEKLEKVGWLEKSCILPANVR